MIGVFKIIDWTNLEVTMGKLGRTKYGPKGYSPKAMLKALILQNWYNLSDTELEEAPGRSLKSETGLYGNHRLRLCS